MTLREKFSAIRDYLNEAEDGIDEKDEFGYLVPKSRLDDALEKHRVAQQTIQAQAGTITKLQTQASDQSKAAAAPNP